jgi:hypothetical protein
MRDAIPDFGKNTMLARSIMSEWLMIGCGRFLSFTGFDWV